MCGITGIYNFNSKIVESYQIEKLNNALTHRGPDGKGIWFNIKNTVALGHRRLSILDLSINGKQPMISNCSSLVIVFNGEIYNFLELKYELQELGYKFSTETDTEVILYAFKHWGTLMFDKFNGMWALAIYDNVSNTLLLSRDRFGVKPLYYVKHNDTFYFASEVQAIHKILGHNWPLNDEVIKDIAKGGFKSHGTNATYLKEVYALPAGHNLKINENYFELKKWYNLKRIKVPVNFNDQAEILKSLIQDACAIRMRSDVPVATCLSGGLDSGTITAFLAKSTDSNANRFNHYTHKGFCASFPNTFLDESNDAKRLAKQLGSEIDVLTISTPTVQDLKLAMQQCDGPMHSLAFYPIWSLYKHIRGNNIKVTLDGQGPDEMLGGYRPLLEALEAAIQLKKTNWFLDVYKTYSSQGEFEQFSSKKFAKVQLILLIVKKGLSPFKKLFRIDFSNSDINRNFTRKYDWINNVFDKSLYNQFFYNPLPGILQQYDRCSMANGVECRMPFMDYRIVEFLFSLPVESKVGGGYTKRILREATKGLLPDETRLNKLKIGFNAPIVDWFRGGIKSFMLDIINSDDFLTSIYFDGKKLRADFYKFIQSKNPSWNEAWKFWPPVHLTWWLNNFKNI
jgi:asparagine synthase (glutamine-hydrolysing)